MKLKSLIVTLSLLSSAAFAHGHPPIIASDEVEVVDKQFPEEGKVYRPGRDTGFDQYKTSSLRGTKKVVLTFDDGPHSVYTPKLLDLLKEYNVKATFFILTEKINASTMPLIKRIVKEGHIISSHHHDHDNNNNKSEAAYRAGLKETALKVAQILEETNSPNREIYYRFPYGAYGSGGLSYHHFNVMKEVSQELFGDNCINFAFWDIDSLDWLKPMSKKDIVSTVIAHVEGGTAYTMGKSKFSGKNKKEKYTISRPMGGGVVLMHDIHEKSIEATEMLLKSFKSKGIEVVPLNEVEEYSYKGKECRLK